MYPSLYQINTRVWLNELSRKLGRPATLADIPDTTLDQWAAAGFSWIWLLSVWRIGPLGAHISRTNPEWRKSFLRSLPDLKDSDIGGSGFAITAYDVNPLLGGDRALEQIRERLRQRGLRLMLDFVPNHTAIDHRWANEHPDFYIQGSSEDLVRSPGNYLSLHTASGERVLAHGRDPYFPGWPDTLQLDYGNPATQQAMTAELLKIASRCDGVRCDMAMLILPQVFSRTWGHPCSPFWPAAIQRVRAELPDFCFMAEVYWDLEWTMQQLGFNYTYDKRLYDRLCARIARPVREHLLADLGYQSKMARFLENHDEPRAAAALPRPAHKAAAVITFLSPGLRFFQEGQFEGRTVQLSPHLTRRPDEPVDTELQEFYRRLLELLRDPIVRTGRWRLLECTAAWSTNWTHDCFVVWMWQSDEQRWLVAVNYADNQSQCYVRVPLPDVSGTTVQFSDLMSSDRFERSGTELRAKGLYLDVPPWRYQVFRMATPRLH